MKMMRGYRIRRRDHQSPRTHLPPLPLQASSIDLAASRHPPVAPIPAVIHFDPLETCVF